jgi:hypothetical protein
VALLHVVTVFAKVQPFLDNIFVEFKMVTDRAYVVSPILRITLATLRDLYVWLESVVILLRKSAVFAECRHGLAFSGCAA